jgi:hypothetical protein
MRFSAPHFAHLLSIRVLPCLMVMALRSNASFTKRSVSSRIACFDISRFLAFCTICPFACSKIRQPTCARVCAQHPEVIRGGFRLETPDKRQAAVAFRLPALAVHIQDAAQSMPGRVDVAQSRPCLAELLAAWCRKVDQSRLRRSRTR